MNECEKECLLQELTGKIQVINNLLVDYPDDIYIGVKKKELPVSFIDDMPVYIEVRVKLEKEIAAKFLLEYKEYVKKQLKELVNKEE